MSKQFIPTTKVVGFLAYCIVNGIYYSSVDRYGDIFRYRNYGAYVLSENEMWKLIDDNNIIVNDEDKEKLKEFWNLYPDGMISFG